MGDIQFTSMPVLEHVLRGMKEHVKKAKSTLTCLPITSTIIFIKNSGSMGKGCKGF